jgi:hypothetical protein
VERSFHAFEWRDMMETVLALSFAFHPIHSPVTPSVLDQIEADASHEERMLILNENESLQNWHKHVSQ